MDSKREKKIHVKLVSREMIKPSTPTPPHLQNHKISLLQQFAQPNYVSLIVVYPPPPKHSNLITSTTSTLLEFQYSSSIILKKSLSETLTRFYPLAGRLIREENIIRCNDEGVEYLEARVEGGLTVSGLIHDQPNYIDSLNVLFSKTHDLLTLSSDEVLVTIQANFFECGGIAIAFSVAHNIADASSMATFLDCWASISRHHHQHITTTTTADIPSAVKIYPTFDAPDVLPPMPPRTPTRQVSLATAIISENRSSKKRPIYTTKTFVFSGSAIAALKAAASQDNNNNIVPSRSEAVIALIWKCVILAMYDQKKNNNKSTQFTLVLIQSVDLRRRLSPPLPDASFGSIVKAAIAAWPPNGHHEYNNKRIPDDGEMYRMMVKQLRDSTSRIDDAYAKNRDFDLRCIGIPLHEPFTKIFTDQTTTEKYICGASSLINFPFYAVDFGWGNPVWVTPPKFRGMTIMLFGNRNAIEALVCLEDGTMRIFEKNPELLAFCSESIGSRL